VSARAGCRRGVTLIELVVALAILSLLLGMVAVDGAHLGRRAAAPPDAGAHLRGVALRLARDTTVVVEDSGNVVLMTALADGRLMTTRQLGSVVPTERSR
jgi:prepilin-type N-terminal cleavage/methylation domain-containing protein